MTAIECSKTSVSRSIVDYGERVSYNVVELSYLRLVDLRRAAGSKQNIRAIRISFPSKIFCETLRITAESNC